MRHEEEVHGKVRRPPPKQRHPPPFVSPAKPDGVVVGYLQGRKLDTIASRAAKKTNKQLRRNPKGYAHKRGPNQIADQDAPKDDE